MLRFLMCALVGVVVVSSNAAAQDARSPQRPALNAMEALGTDSTAWQRVITFVASWHSVQFPRAATNVALQPWRIRLSAAGPQRALVDDQLRRVLRAREPVNGDSVVYARSLGALRIAGGSAHVKFRSVLTQQARAADSSGIDRDFARIVDSVRIATNMPALAAAVMTGDSLLAHATTGLRRAEGTVPVTDTDRFHLGSDTKSMTAGLIGTLVDAGLVSFTTTLAELWPELLPVMRAEYRPVTVADLLDHRSGLPANTTVRFMDSTERAQRVSLVKWAVAHPPVSARGLYAYSNVNYAMAGAIAERVTGQSYQQLMHERIFAPLGMRTAGWGPAGAAGLSAGEEDQPWQHRIGTDGTRIAVAPSPLADNQPATAPAGRAHMSVSDWALWGRAVLRAASGRPSLWRNSTARMLTSPTTPVNGDDRYGNGWLGTTRPWGGPTGRVLTHSGTNTMNFAVAWLAPAIDVGFLVVTNQGGDAAGKATDALVGRLLEWHRTRRAAAR